MLTSASAGCRVAAANAIGRPSILPARIDWQRSEKTLALSAASWQKLQAFRVVSPAEQEAKQEASSDLALCALMQCRKS